MATTPDPESVTLTWSPSTSDAGPITYEILRDGVLVATVPDSGSPQFSESGLTPSTTYHYSVIAVDQNVNQSIAAMVNATTTSQDNMPPSPPTNLLVTGNVNGSISISWSPASDNVGVTGYKIDDGSGRNQTSTTNSFTDSVTPGQTYTFSVTALDAAGNGLSSVDSVSVVAVTGTPVVDTHERPIYSAGLAGLFLQ